MFQQQPFPKIATFAAIVYPPSLTQHLCLWKADKTDRICSNRLGSELRRRLDVATASLEADFTIFSLLQFGCSARLLSANRTIPEALFSSVQWPFRSHMCVLWNGNDAEVPALGGAGDAPRQLGLPGINQDHPGTSTS